MYGPLALIALAVTVLVTAYGYGLWDFGAPGAGLMPCFGAALLLVCSLFSLREKLATAEGRPDFGRVFGYGTGLLLLYPGTLLLGMLPALGIFILLLLRFAEGARWPGAMLVALVSSAAGWLLFGQLLQVPLPQAVFW